MTPWILLSALIFLPLASTSVDRTRLPELAYLSIIGIACAAHLVRAKARLSLGGIWLVYLLAVGASIAMAANPALGLSRFSMDLIGAVIFWYVVVFVRQRQLEKLPDWCLAVALGAVFFSLTGQIHDREFVAGVAVMAIPLAFASLMYKPVLRPIAALVLLGWLVTSSRRADLVALATGLVVCLPVGKVRTSALVAALVAVIGLWSWSFNPVVGRELVDRFDIWGNATAFASSVGIGRGNLPIALYPLSQYGHEYKSVLAFLHNDYLDLWAEAGPVALFAFLFLVGRILEFRPVSLLPGAANLERVLYASIVVALVRSVFHSTFVFPAAVAWFWLFLGMYWRLVDERLHPDCPDRARLWQSRSFLSGTSFWE